MKVSLQFKDDGDSSGILHGEAIVEFEFKMKDAFKAIQKLQQHNIAGAIAKALSGEEPTEGDE